MKNLLKKAAALSVASLITLSVLTACGETVALLDFIEEGSDVVDLDGYVFKLMQTENADSTGIILSDEDIFGYPATTTLNDAARKRISDIESSMNCEIEIETASYSAEDLFAKFIGGSVGYDAVYSASTVLTVNSAKFGILLPVEDYGDYIDFMNTEKYGEVNVVEASSHKGSIYGVTPISWVYKQPRTVGLTVFNMDLVEQYGKADPKEAFEQGNWTWDTFEHIIDDYYVNEGDKVIHSLAVRSYDMIALAAMSNGVRFADVSADGTVMETMTSNKMLEACDWYIDISRNYADHLALKMTTDGVNWEEVNEEFCVKKDSMACITAPDVLFSDIIYEIPKYSVLPFPMGPQGVYGEWAGAMEAAEAFSVFLTANEPEVAFRIIDKICEPLEGFETKEDIISYLSESVLYSREDAEMVMELKNYGQYTYYPHGDDYSITQFYRDFTNKWQTSTPTEIIDSHRNKISEYLIEIVEPNLSIYELYE